LLGLAGSQGSEPPQGEEDGEQQQEDEEEALMAWVTGARTPGAQLGRARQALRELLRERDAASQGGQQVRASLISRLVACLRA